MRSALLVVASAVAAAALDPIPQRVAALLAQMTLEEKIAQMNLIHLDSMNFSSVPAPYQSTGVGAVVIEQVPNDAACGTACRISRARALQQAITAGSRLGIPVSFVTETSHSGGAGATLFPMGALLGASWNSSLVTAVFDAIGREARAWGADRGLSPEINVVTDPRFGRSEENFGGDPLLVTTLTEAATIGLQGGRAQPSEYMDDVLHVAAEAKHAIAYGYGGYDGAAADISPKTLHDVYLGPWRRFIQVGGRSMMMSHNDLNGEQMHASSSVMTDLFRGQYGYQGFYGSDDNNIFALASAHVAANISEAAILAVNAGMDQAFLDAAYSTDILSAAVAAGRVNMSAIDRAAGAVLTTKFAAGLFDGALPDPTNAPILGSNRALARAAVADSVILLTNQNNALPLQLGKIKTLAVIGPNSGCLGFATANPWNCEAMRGQLGGYSNQEQANDQYNGNSVHTVTVLEAAVNAANASGNAFQVQWAQGVPTTGYNSSGIAAAAAVAAAADAVLLVLGDNGEAVGYDASASCGEGADRPSLDLPGVQLDLWAAVTAANPSTVVVLFHGRPVTFGEDYGGSQVSKYQANGGAPLRQRAAAILSAWRAGCEGGNGVWDVLSGAVSPSGRLAQSWPYSAGAAHLGGLAPWMQKWCSEECGGFTLNTPYAPMFPFGGGLSYLSVSYGASTAAVDAVGLTVTVNVTVTNAAPMAGGHVVQVYFSQSVSRYTRYRRMLGGFTKVHLPPQGSVQVSMVVPYEALAHYDPRIDQRIVEASEYTLYVCYSSTDCPSGNVMTISIPATTPISPP